MEIFKVYSQKVAGQLMVRGFVLKGIEPNPNGKYNIFLFRDSTDIREAMAEITNK